MPNRVVAQVNGGFAKPKNVDPVEERARDELATGVAFGLVTRPDEPRDAFEPAETQ